MRNRRSRRKYPRIKRVLRWGGLAARWAVRFAPMTPQERAALIIAMNGVGFMKRNRKGDK